MAAPFYYSDMTSEETITQENESHAGIYIHFPFCVQRCAYCSFVSFLYDREVARNYIGLIISEIKMWSRLYGKGSANAQKAYDSIYLGGGTPSLIEPEAWESVLETITRHFSVSPEAEITIEANPNTFDLAKARRWGKAGINRVSLGVQSLIDSELAVMRRLHNSKDTLRAVRDLKEAGFENISMDLLVGYATQTVNTISYSIDGVLRCEPAHVSVYLLEIKEGAAISESFGSGEFEPLDEDLSADMYELVCNKMNQNGFQQYEISNFCKPGKRSIHNMKYWTDGFYLGIGSGAHGRLEDIRYSNEAAIEDYCRKTAQDEFPWKTQLRLDPYTRMTEALIMGLRLNQGVDLISLTERYSIDVRGFIANRLRSLQAAGLFEFGDGFLRLTDRGRLLSNLVFEKLI
ncbi:MAG: radical SAM family heme chaperone HemW [Desulfomonilaceae bacterium]